MHGEIQNRIPEIADLCRRYEVRQLVVFGSAARGDDFDPERSDADFLVEFQKESGADPLEQFFRFRSELSKTLGRPVDLVEIGAIRNPYIKDDIQRHQELVYAA